MLSTILSFTSLCFSSPAAHRVLHLLNIDMFLYELNSSFFNTYYCPSWILRYHDRHRQSLQPKRDLSSKTQIIPESFQLHLVISVLHQLCWPGLMTPVIYINMVFTMWKCQLIIGSTEKYLTWSESTSWHTAYDTDDALMKRWPFCHVFGVSLFNFSLHNEKQ